MKAFRVRLILSAGFLLCACGSLVFEDAAQGDPSLQAGPGGGTGGQGEIVPTVGGDTGAGGTSAGGSCSGDSLEAGCCDPAQKAATSPALESAYVLAIASDASADRVLRIYVKLADPTDQDQVVGLLGERGATDIARLGAGKEVGADLKARYVREVLCWESVVSMRSERSYWGIIDRQWNVEELGSKQCPVAGDGACYTHCTGVWGRLVGVQQACIGPRELLTCSTDEIEPPSPGGCRVKVATGQIYDFEQEAPREQEFMGWRECTPSEAALRECALSTPCP